LPLGGSRPLITVLDGHGNLPAFSAGITRGSSLIRSTP
jgi:hypothetical protein